MLWSAKKQLFRTISAATRSVKSFIPNPKPMTLNGAGSLDNLGRMMASLGWRKPLIVTDATLVKLGVINPLLETLKASELEYAIYDGIQPDPTFAEVNTGLGMLQLHHCDSVIAFGGGSSIDAAKLIKVGATHDMSTRKFAGLLKCSNKGLPFVAIPTTAGTGSEVTIAAVISDEITHSKSVAIDPRLVPDVAVLDAKLMVGLPPHITAATGMDALTHAIEAYIGRWHTPGTDEQAVAATRLIFEHLERAYQDGSDLAAREALANAAHFAGLAFTQANVGYVHAFAHQVGGKYGVPHGLANAVLLPHVLRFNLQAAEERLAKLALATGIASEGDSRPAQARKLVEHITELNHKLGIPSQLDKLQERHIPALAKAALDEAVLTPYPVPKYMKPAQAERLLLEVMA